MFLALAIAIASSLGAQRPRVIVDQDARGLGLTDMNSILMFAQSPDVVFLGLTIVTGDQDR